MKTKNLLVKLSKKYPKKYAKENHDFVGLMSGSLPLETRKIVLCLDMDESIFEEVKTIRPDIVITHHPFIYGPKHIILKHDLAKKDLVERMNALNIPVYSFHTNFDTGKDGMNDALSKALGLTNVYTPEFDKMMRIGYLPKKMEIHEFAKMAKEAFDVEYGLLINEGKKEIEKVGIIGGGGSREYKIAMLENCDIYISGDAPHHVRRDIVLAKYNYLDLPHEIERIFMKQMKKVLLEIDENLEIICLDQERLPEVI